MSKPYHIYLDLDVLNNDTAPTSRAPALSFEETRTHPFLEGSASDYFVSIVRFSIQTGTSLPVFIPRIATGATENPTNDINKTIYKISIQYQSTATSGLAYKTRNIAYQPFASLEPPKNPNESGQDLSGNYYHVKNYEDWITMVNKAFKDLWTEVVADTLITAGGQNYPPFIEMDPTTYICTLNAPKTYFESNNADGSGPQMNLFFNTRLFELFTGFPNKLLSYGGDYNYQLRIGSNNSGTNVLKVSGTEPEIKYIQMHQEVCTIGMWNPVASIAFTSTTLPVAQTLTGVPKQLTSSSDGMVGSGAPNVINILSDFEIPVSAVNQYRPEISYTPQAEYRLVDMYENSDLRKLDISVFWKDRFGNLNPFRLQPGCAASIKLLFRHKHFYLGIF